VRLLIQTINCVFHLRYQVFDGINICNICDNDGVYDILQRHALLTKQTCHTFLRALQLKLLTATQYSSDYLFIMLMFSSIISQSRYKRFCVSFSFSFSTCPFQHSIIFNRLPEHNVTGTQPDASMHPEHVLLMARMFLHICQERTCLYELPPKTHA
jgi:hypothetical protein